MAVFIYKAKKGPTEIVSGEIEADSQEQAVGKLEEMELVPVSIVEKAEYRRRQTRRPQSSALAAEFTKIGEREIDIFTRQLASLIKASVPVLRALSLISEQTENKELKDMVGDLREEVKEGRVLSEAMAKYPRVFNNLYLSMVKSGEKGGVLDEVLYRLADYREKRAEVKRKIQAALAYPLLMIAVGAATIFVMLTFFLPKFVGLFENMKRSLPLPTKILMGLSGFMSDNWYWFLMALVFGIVVFGRVRPGSKKKFLFDAIKLHTPFMKKFVKDAEITKFARTLSLLLKSGLPVYESLELATGTLDNEALRRELTRVSEEIIQGSALSSSLKKVNIFPNFAVNMIAVGEESGKLEESLNEIANVYEREVEQAVKILTSLLEPLLILVIGAVVGFIVFAMLLPIFDIGVMAR